MPFVGSEGKVEAWLAACDVTCSCFSTCCYDTLFLNRYSPVPLGAVVYLLFDNDIKNYAEQVNGFTMPPPVRHGAALCVRDKNQLETLLRYAAQPITRKNTWIRAQEYLPDATRSADLILDAIEADVKRPAISLNVHGRNNGSSFQGIQLRKTERTP